MAQIIPVSIFRDHFQSHSLYLHGAACLVICTGLSYSVVTEAEGKEEETAVTNLFSLYDFPIKKGTEIEKGYLLGRYGAIPFIKRGE